MPRAAAQENFGSAHMNHPPPRLPPSMDGVVVVPRARQFPRRSFYCGTNIFRTRRGSKRTCERSPRALWFRAFLVRAEQCPANISARQIAPKSSPRRAPFYGNNSAIPFKAPAGSLQRFLFPARRAPRYVRRRLGKKPSKSYFTLLYRRNSQTQTRKNRIRRNAF